VIADGAGITVETFALSKRGVTAAVGSQAGVVGAGVLVVAKGHEFALELVRFVDATVAVFIDSVALFGGRNHCVTVSNAILRADPLTLTDSKLINVGTRCEERELNGLRSARTDASVGHALQCVDPIDCDCR
jgi:hypothetical protein